MDAITVPADVGTELRSALYMEMSRSGADLEAACATTIPGDVARPVSKLRATFALLDDIGWEKAPPPDTLTIDGKHLGVVVETLEEDWQGWMAAADAKPSIESKQGRERAKATADMIWQYLSDELNGRTGDELLEVMAPAKVIEFVEALRTDGRALAAFPGRQGRHVPRDRDMTMLRERLIDNRTLTQIGQQHGVTDETVRRALVYHFGVRGWRRW